MRDFLTTYLGSDWSIQSLKGDSGERQYSRVKASSHKTFILVSYPLNLRKNLKSFVLIQDLLQKKNIFVPKIFFKDEAKGLLLIEDLGDVNLEQFYFKHHQLIFHKVAIDQMIYFQNELKDIRFEKNFTFNQSINEMIYTYQQFYFPYSESEKIKLFEEFQDISKKLSSGTLVPSHRDFHSRNLHIKKDQLYMIDFQDAGLYPMHYDLVSLVEDAYLPLSDKDKSILMEYYSQKTNQPTSSWDEMVCQRLFKAAGNFMSFYHIRNQKTHLKYIKPVLKRVESSLIKLESYPRFLKYTQTLMSQL